MFGSKRKTYVASTSAPVHEIIPNTVRYSVNEALAYDVSIGSNIVENLVNGVNQSYRRGLKYAKAEYANGLPHATIGVLGPSEVRIKEYLDQLENTSVELGDIYLDIENEDMEIYRHLYAAHKWDGRDVLTQPTGMPRAKLNEIAIEVRLGWVEEIRNEIYNEHTYEEIIGNVKNTYTASVLYKGYDILEKEALCFLIGLETVNTYLDRSSIHRFKRDDGSIGEQVYKALVRMNFGFRVRYLLNSKFDVLQTVKTETTTVDENNNPVVTTTFSQNYLPIIREVEREDEDFAGFMEEKEVTISKEESMLVFYKAHNEWKLLDYKRPTIFLGRIISNPNLGAPTDLMDSAEVSLAGDFYPILNLRDNNRDPSRADQVNTPVYKTSKKLGKRLRADWLDLIDAINENPDIRDIDYAHLVHGINLNTETNEGIKYLLEFFKEVQTFASIDRDTFIQYMEDQLAESSNIEHFNIHVRKGYRNNIVKFRDQQAGRGGYRTNIHFNYITVETKTGVIGKKGKCTKEIVINGRSTGIPEGEHVRFKNLHFALVESFSEEWVLFKEQISETEYQEVLVHGLVHVNFAYEGHAVVTKLEDIGNIDKEGNFVIPLYEPIVKLMSIIQRDKLHYESRLIVINTYQVVKIKWYQSSFFSFLLIIASIAIGFYINPGLGAKIGAAVAAGVKAVIILVAQMAFNMILTQLAFKLVVKIIGVDAAMILAVLVAAYTLGQGIQAGSFSAIPNGDVLVQVATGLTGGVQSNIHSEMKSLTGEADAFLIDSKEKMNALNEIEKDLDTKNFIDPLWFIEHKPLFVVGESPDEFFGRTIHQGNAGTLSYDMLSSYFDIMLKLPELKDTPELDEDTEYV